MGAPIRDYVTIPDFYAEAKKLRERYNEVHSTILSHPVPQSRFCWDYWSIPGNFLYFRTHASSLLGPELHDPFFQFLSEWGLKNLGTGAINTNWISFYIDGCYQRLHIDRSQGAWAFAYSLSMNDANKFMGGETLFLQPQLLDYWESNISGPDISTGGIYAKIPPHFNQMVIFDGRIPHAVQMVEGTKDPLEARVVIHGWFDRPSLRSDGALSISEVKPVMDDFRASDLAAYFENASGKGIVTYQIKIQSTGIPSSVTCLSDTLVLSRASELKLGSVAVRQRNVAEMLAALKFPDADAGSTIIFPIEAIG
ncbi:2OG-Fe(II) oxygenase [Burkholderia glumae]